MPNWLRVVKSELTTRQFMGSSLLALKGVVLTEHQGLEYQNQEEAPIFDSFYQPFTLAFLSFFGKKSAKF